MDRSGRALRRGERGLDVTWDGRLVGRLTQDRHGEPGFAYADEWRRRGDSPALSVSLPKREAPFTRRECRPFFAGLLPEGSQRDAAARALGVSAGNDFALLARLGGDVAGALRLSPSEEPREAGDSRRRPERLDEAGLARVLDALPSRPLLAGEGDLRLSLAGAQSKLPVVLVDGAVALPAPGQPTTHILKPPSARFPGAVENEAFVMRLAATAGLDAARVEPRSARGHAFLLVERYDRAFGAGGRVRRIHQEDFCQALAIPPERKYAAEGGPAFRDCFALLRRVSARPEHDARKLLDAAIFNIVAGNADAHGKNFSLLYDESGPRLAPLYDLLATVVWPQLSPRLAMRIGRRATLEEMDAEGWATFAGEAGLDLSAVRRRVGEIAESVASRARGVSDTLAGPGLDGEVLSRLAENVAERAKRCALTTGR